MNFNLVEEEFVFISIQNALEVFRLQIFRNISGHSAVF